MLGSKIQKKHIAEREDQGETLEVILPILATSRNLDEELWST